MQIKKSVVSKFRLTTCATVSGLFLMLLSLQVFSQTNEQPARQGKLVIYQTAEVDTLVERTANANTPKSTLKGYRIQIYSGSNRVDANKVRTDFLDTYQGEKIYFDYKQPYYKVRIGDYRNKIEAQKMYQSLLLDPRFNGVLIVPDEINFPELKTIPQTNE
jgi:hypothetical protein